MRHQIAVDGDPLRGGDQTNRLCGIDGDTGTAADHDFTAGQRETSTRPLSQRTLDGIFQIERRQHQVSRAHEIATGGQPIGRGRELVDRHGHIDLGSVTDEDAAVAIDGVAGEAGAEQAGIELKGGLHRRRLRQYCAARDVDAGLQRQIEGHCTTSNISRA